MKNESREKQGIVYLIGAGPGDPGLITVKGRERLRNCDAVVYDHLASQELLEETKADCQKIYVGKQAGCHYKSQKEINSILVELAAKGLRVARLKGGDPFVFGRGGEEILALKDAGLSWEVVPGVTSAVAVPECAGIPVTHRSLSQSFHVITAHGKEGEDRLDFEQLASLSGTLLFLMGLGRLPFLTHGLLQAGKEGSCPAAVIEKGSLPGQRTVRGTLENISEQVRLAGLSTPAVIVIGETAGMDLSGIPGWTVGITGSEHFCRRLADCFHSLGIGTRQLGGLELRPLTGENWEKVYSSMGSFTVLAFTSANGAELFLKGLLERGMDGRSLAHLKIAAVGEGTKEALKRFGLVADWVPERYTTEDLARLLAERCQPGDRVLIPRSVKGSRQLNRILEGAGVSYEDIPIYEVEGRSFDASLLDGLDGLAFGSASGAEAFWREIEARSDPDALKKLEGILVGAIGPYTSEALSRHGISGVLCPSAFTAEKLAQEMWSALKSGRNPRDVLKS